MPARGHSDEATLLHVFKEVLGLEEDSDPLKALAQEGYNDISGFLSIDDSDLAHLTIRETTEATIGNQVKQITRDKPLLKHHIGKMRSLSQWHCFMMAKTGKRLTNDEWFQLDKDTFDDFRIQYPAPAVPALKTFEHNLHLSALGGESPKPIQEVVTTWNALEGEPSTFKMDMMPTCFPEDCIESMYLTTPDEDSHEDKTISQTLDKVKFLVSVEQSKPDEIVSFNGIIQFANKEVDYGDEQKYCGLKQLVGQQEPFQSDDVQYKGSSSHVVKILPTIAADDPGIEWDSTTIIEADDPGLELAHHAHADPHDEQEPNNAPPSPAPNNDVQTLIGADDRICCADCTSCTCADCTSCTPYFYLEGDNLQVCHSLLLQSTVNVCIRDLGFSRRDHFL